MSRVVRESQFEEEMKIYAVTAMNEDQIQDDIWSYGIEEVLTKPVQMSKIKNIITGIFSI